jgi:hypothetical protein
VARYAPAVVRCRLRRVAVLLARRVSGDFSTTFFSSKEEVLCADRYVN